MTPQAPTSGRAAIRPTRRGEPPLNIRNGAYRAAGTRVKVDPLTIPVIAVLMMFTVSSTGVLVFGLPRPTLISLPITFYMLARLGGRIGPAFTRFSFAYVAAFIPGLIYNLTALHGDIKLTSIYQGLAALVTFATLASYFSVWLVYYPPAKQKRDLTYMLWGYLFFSVIELLNFRYFSDIRFAIYPTSFTNSIQQIFIEREVGLYGGRATGLYSEPSNFARCMGLMLAAYITVTNRSALSLRTTALFVLATRSISLFFAAPVMLGALLVTPLVKVGGRPVARMSKTSRYLLLTGGLLVGLVVIGLTQSSRIQGALATTGSWSALQSNDNSFNSRILYPITYLFNANPAPIMGAGPTPQDDIQQYTLDTEMAIYHWRPDATYLEGISSSVVMIGGMGILGLLIFGTLMTLFFPGYGISLALLFILVNIINSGYNSVVTFVPSALLVALLLYQRGQSGGFREHKRLRIV